MPVAAASLAWGLPTNKLIGKIVVKNDVIQLIFTLDFKLYNGDSRITAKLPQENLYPGDTFIGDICYSGHFFEYRVNILGNIFLSIEDTL